MTFISWGNEVPITKVLQKVWTFKRSCKDYPEEWGISRDPISMDRNQLPQGKERALGLLSSYSSTSSLQYPEQVSPKILFCEKRLRITNSRITGSYEKLKRKFTNNTNNKHCLHSVLSSPPFLPLPAFMMPHNSLSHPLPGLSYPKGKGLIIHTKLGVINGIN